MQIGNRICFEIQINLGSADGGGDVLVDKGKVVASQLLRQGQRLLHLMIVGSDTEAAGAENGFLTRGKMWLLIEVGLSLILHTLGNTSSIAKNAHHPMSLC